MPMPASGGYLLLTAGISRVLSPSGARAIYWHENCGFPAKRAACARFFCFPGGIVGPPHVAERVWEIVEPVAAHGGFEIVDVEYRPERGRMVLRIFADRESGVTLDDLARLSRELGDLLEVHSVIGAPYTLEVSSPGVNRRLTRPEHFPRFVGRRIRVRTDTPMEGRRNFLGILLAVTEAGVALQLEDGGEVRIPFAMIARANYEHDFDTKRGAAALRRGPKVPLGRGRRA